MNILKSFFAASCVLVTSMGTAGTSYVELATCVDDLNRTSRIGVETDLEERTAISGSLTVGEEFFMDAPYTELSFIAAGGGSWNLFLNGLVQANISFESGEHGAEVYLHFADSAKALDNCTVDFGALEKIAPRPY